MKELGKIQHNTFEDIIFQNCGYPRKEVKIGPRFGVDVAIIDLPNGLGMALTSDPLSLIPSLGLQESAWLSVHLMANDMATTGCPPQYGQFVLNLPADFSASDLKIYWGHIHTFCKDIGIAITGGHTGFIEGQNSTIAGGGTLITIASKEHLLVSSNAKPTNIILATKQCAISSAAILAMSFPETVKNKLGKQVYNDGCNLFYQTSSLKDALTAVGNAHERTEITAMHDVTEGGILGAIYELAVASNNGVIVYNDALPIGETPKQICHLFNIDPRYCIGAGSMIIAVGKDHGNAVIARLKVQNIDCVVVGELTEKENGIHIIEKDEKKPLLYLEKDPYWNAFFDAYKMGWK